MHERLSIVPSILALCTVQLGNFVLEFAELTIEPIAPLQERIARGWPEPRNVAKSWKREPALGTRDRCVIGFVQRTLTGRAGECGQPHNYRKSPGREGAGTLTDARSRQKTPEQKRWRLFRRGFVEWLNWRIDGARDDRFKGR